MVELEGGSKLVLVDSQTPLCISLKKEKEKTKVETKEYNVEALKNENAELKSKIVLLKRDFEKIIDEVRTLQKCVSEQSQKTKNKFIKIKMIVSTLKKEREILFIQNKSFSDQIETLDKENGFLRELLGQNQVEKEAGNECSEAKKETQKERKQSTENRTVEEKKETTPLKVDDNTLSIKVHKLSKKNILKWNNGNTNVEGKKMSFQLLPQLQQMGTKQMKPKQQNKRVKNRNQINYFVSPTIKCNKTLMKKTTKSLAKNIWIISKNKKFLLSFSYLFSLFPLSPLTPLTTLSPLSPLFSETLQTCKSFQITKSLHWYNKSDKEISSKYIKKNSFSPHTYLNPNKKNSCIHLKQKYCNVSVFSNKPETDFLYNTKKKEKVEETYNTDTIYMHLKKGTENKIQEKETHEYEFIQEPEKNVKETETETETETEAETKTETETETKTETKTETDKNLVTSNINNEVVEWKMKNKEKEYLLHNTLKICQNLRTEELEKFQKEINEHVPTIAINCKTEKKFHLLKTEHFINETAFYHFLSICIDSIYKHITHQNKKINEFEMNINNINIFSHNLIDIINETSYIKFPKNDNNHKSILLIIRKIINECQ